MTRVRLLSSTPASPDDRPVGTHPHTGQPLYTVLSKEPTRPSPTRQVINVAKAAGHAAKSIAKTSLGIGRATDEQVDARLSICRNCPGRYAVFRDRELHTCGPMVSSAIQAGGGPCGCVLSKKARDLAENCPFGWWPKQGIAGPPNSDKI